MLCRHIPLRFVYKNKKKEHKHILRILYILYNNIQNKMNWSFIVCLIYIWKTRGISVAGGVKSCTNCKFFLPPTLDMYNKQTITLGKCLLYPYPDQTIPTLVVGMDEMDVGGKFQYAVTARTSETMCGHTARHFSPRIRPPSPPPHYPKTH